MAKNPSKSGKCIKQTYILPFWGMLALTSGLRFFVSLLKMPLFGTLKLALLAKVPVLKCQKMALWVPKQKNGDHFFMPTTPQNGDKYVCFMRLAHLGGF